MDFDEYGDPKQHTIVMLHGAAATDTFANQYCLSQTYHLVIPHLSGAGRAVDKPYEPQHELDELTAFIGALGQQKVTLVGHSLGAELAVALVSKHPELFDRAVFMSAWVCASPKSVQKFVRMAKYTSFTLRWSWMVYLQGKYWGYTDAQAKRMAEYAAKIPRSTYLAWFQNRIYLNDLPTYATVTIPMLAVCGDREIMEMKDSIAQLGRRNPNCKTVMLKGANHDFPMRKAKETTLLLQQFLKA